MSKTTTRRSISISGPLFDKLKAHCLEKDISMSSFVEQRTKEFLSKQEEPAPRTFKKEPPPLGVRRQS